MRAAWLVGGICFGLIGILCWQANLKEFAVGCLVLGIGMITESWVGGDK